MNKLIYRISLFLLAFVVFTACNEDAPDLYPSELVKGAYLINYGNYGSGGASISKFDYENNELTNNYFQMQNDGIELLSNIQFAFNYNDSIYLIGNNSDQIIVVNPLFIQTRNGITEGIANPRYCVANGDYLYISCLGEEPDWSTMPDSYIAKFNTKTSTVEATIALPGGAEGLAIANNKLYAALNYAAKVAVISLTDHAISYIEIPAASSYFVKDNSENLYVSLVSNFAIFSSETGLGYINTKTDVLSEVYQLDGISNSYGSIISANSDVSKIYVLATQYDENWNLSGAVHSFDVSSATYTQFISGISGPTGVVANPIDHKIYLLTSESVTEGGSLKVYAEDGQLENEFATGSSPTMAIFLE